MSFFFINTKLLKRDIDLLIITVLSKVDAHAFKSISCQDWDQTGVFFLELICDVFEGFSHGVLDHLFFSLLDLLEPFVEVVKHLHQEWWAVVLHLLPHHCNTLLF